jgi:DNA-binding LytR/AlgR family response regulator
MERYKYIIIDDDFPTHLAVQHHFKAYPNYEFVAYFHNPGNALFYLKEHKIDLIFLDIQMREMSGFQFLEALEERHFVVILTAFEDKHCLQAHQYYDKDLVYFTNKAQFSHYLPKIIERFEKMHSEKKTLSRVKQLSKNEITTFPKMINKKPILLVDIVYITVVGHHIILKMMNNEELVFRMTLRELLSILPSNCFFQITRNTVININYVTSFTHSTVCIENKHFIISFRNRKKIVLAIKMQKDFLYQNY